MAERISFSRRNIVTRLYYWGNTPAVDCLNLEENEGADYNSPVNLLYLGVGDLRNVILTCASLPESYNGKVNFTLNDIAESTLARLVLLLYMPLTGKYFVVYLLSLLLAQAEKSVQRRRYTLLAKAINHGNTNQLNIDADSTAFLS